MSRLFLTADYHFGHANIAKYSDRPWFKPFKPDFKTEEDALECARRMDDGLIKFANERVKKGDRVLHIGDFLTRGRAKGKMGLKKHWNQYLDELNGYWTLLQGNHDSQNKVKTFGKHLFFEHAGRQIFASHYPLDSDTMDPALVEYVVSNCDFAVCGHVHASWKVKEIHVTHGKPPFLNINVGIDVWNLRPVTADEVVALWEKEASK